MNSNSNEIVIRDSFTTRKKDSFIDIETSIDIETRSLYNYNDFLDISKLLNNSDKVCLYYELL